MPLLPFEKGECCNSSMGANRAPRKDLSQSRNSLGHRGAILIVDVKDPSAIPGIAEPFFLSFNATCKLRIAMTPDELGRSGIEKFSSGW
jgi:hypothetical protein